MPKFNLAPKPENLDPQWQPQSQSMGTGERRMTPGEARDYGNRRIENAAGPLKPLVQFANTLASPDTKIGIFTGPINGISKLGNAIGDLVQGKAIDVSDAWTISDEQARRINPARWITDQHVGPSDTPGLQFGEAIGAELAGAATGAALLNKAKQLQRLQQLARTMQQTTAVRRAAVTISTSRGLTAAANVTRNVGEALGSTVLATPFLDQADGNAANALQDLTGLKVPGAVESSDNYLQALGKSIGVEGVAMPLALLGMGSFIKPIREGLAQGNPGWIEELAKAELEPYLPRPMAGPALPPAGQAGLPQLPGYTPQGGALVPYDSALTRSLQEQTQIRQVVEQRQRLQQMGLVQQGEGGQLDLSLGGAVDPEIRLQVRQLQTQRGQLIKQGMESGEDVTQQLGQIDQQIGDLIQQGNSQDFMPGERFTQPELDMPDGRPELDTYLANLDELSDAQLRQVHSRVYVEQSIERNKQDLLAAQQRVQEIQARIADIDQRKQAGGLTDVGAKRLLTKAEKDLALAQQEVTTVQARSRVPESLVGDQLQMHLESQLGLDLSAPLTYRQAPVPEKPAGIPTASLEGDQLGLAIDPAQLTVNNAPLPELPPVSVVERAASIYGYQTPDDYRSALQAFSRDTLRRMTSPEQSADIAAIVKARTGRRVWAAKKSDIIDALVERAQRLGRFAPEQFDQPDFKLQVDDAPWKKWEPVLKFLFEDKSRALTQKAADLNVPGMTRVVDADGAERMVPAVEYSPGGPRSLSQPEPPAPRKPETATQLSAELTTNPAGADAPLFNQPADLQVPGMKVVLDADGKEQLVPAMDYSGRGMDAATRERLKAEILQRAIDNGEVQPPVTPLPNRPAARFEQGTLIDDLMADPTGQMPLLFATDALPAYKAGGKNADALIEEMRLRFQYNLLDEQAQRAQQQAMMAAHGWDTLSWEEKKKLGILGEGFYSLQPYSERFQPPTPAARSDLGMEAVPPRKPKVYTWKPGGELIEGNAKPKPKEAAAAKKAEAAAAKATKAEVKVQNQDLANKKAALLKQREELLRKSKGANC